MLIFQPIISEILKAKNILWRFSKLLYKDNLSETTISYSIEVKKEKLKDLLS